MKQLARKNKINLTDAVGLNRLKLVLLVTPQGRSI